MSAGLQCWACGQREPFDVHAHRCRRCGEALEITPPAAPLSLDPPWGSAGPWRGGAVRRYAGALVPPGGDRHGYLAGLAGASMGEGGTPLLAAGRLGDDLDVDLLLKDETRNPTGSFKDRGTVHAVAALVALGHEAVGTVSTGNMARSVAAHAARAGLRCTVWVGASTPPEKLAPVAVHGAVVARFEAPYGDIYARSLEWSRQQDVPFVNSDSALRVEGQQTTAWELAEELGGEAPDWLVVPTSSGGNLAALARGFALAVERGWLDRAPRLAAVQAAGCAPIATAWHRGEAQPAAWTEARTVAGAISNPSPPSGARALAWLRRSHGAAVAVDDEAIVASQARLAAATGRYVQPASAATLAGLEELLRQGAVARGGRVVLLLTGQGPNAAPPRLAVPTASSLERPPSLQGSSSS